MPPKLNSSFDIQKFVRKQNAPSSRPAGKFSMLAVEEQRVQRFANLEQQLRRLPDPSAAAAAAAPPRPAVAGPSHYQAFLEAENEQRRLGAGNFKEMVPMEDPSFSTENIQAILQKPGTGMHIRSTLKALEDLGGTDEAERLLFESCLQPITTQMNPHTLRNRLKEAVFYSMCVMRVLPKIPLEDHWLRSTVSQAACYYLKWRVCFQLHICALIVAYTSLQVYSSKGRNGNQYISTITLGNMLSHFLALIAAKTFDFDGSRCGLKLLASGLLERLQATVKASECLHRLLLWANLTANCFSGHRIRA